jgi:putative transcriptional regulator
MEKQTINLERGVLLLSAPFLNDIFRRSVILLTEHNNEGSVGFIINKLSNYKLNEIVDDFPEFAAPVYVGGPVEQNMLNFIHKSQELAGGIEICKDVYWGGDFENLRFMIESGLANPDDFRFILGYSGWGPSQLDNELEHDSWYLSKTDSDFVFSNEPANLWGQALRKLGNKYAFISTFPDDPSVN